MKVNRVRSRLKEGKFVIGSWVSLCSLVGADVMGTIGFDWLLIDMEHGTGDYQTLLGQIQAINAMGDSTPIVRVQWNDPVIIKRILDTGAEGVMVPGIRSVAEAKAAVAAIKYPPDGIRSVAFPRSSRYGQDPNYLKEANGNTAMFLQIETIDAVNAIDEILDVPGIDVAFIGPNDLAADMGHIGNMAHPDVVAAIKKTEDAANKRGIPLGSVSRNYDQALAMIDKGYRAAALMSDVGFLIQSARGGMEKVRAHKNFANQ